MINRAYFYSEPNDGKMVKGLFLIPGDKFNSYSIFKNFVFGSYIRKNGSIVIGWLKKSSLTKLNVSLNKKGNEINKNDFIITSPGGDVKIDDSYEGFYKKWSTCEVNKQPEIGMTGNFIYKGGDAYKYFDNVRLP